MSRQKQWQMVRWQMFLPPEHHSELEKLARETGQSMGEHVRLALDDYFVKLRRKLDNTAAAR